MHRTNFLFFISGTRLLLFFLIKCLLCSESLSIIYPILCKYVKMKLEEISRKRAWVNIAKTIILYCKKRNALESRKWIISFVEVVCILKFTLR